MGRADGDSVVGRADGDSVHEHKGGDGDVIQLSLGMGDSDSVFEQRRGIWDSVGVKGCELVSRNGINNILRRERVVRTPPSRMRCTGPSAGKSSRPGSGRTTTSPWRGVGAGSRTIGRRTSTPGSKGTSLPTQRIAVASKVGKLIAMHHGLIAKQTNRGVEPDQWTASRYSREQGANGSQ